MSRVKTINDISKSFDYILVAEDDEDDQELLKDAFLETDIGTSQIRFVSDGQELMNSLNEASTLPNLILLDLNMPRKNGMQSLTEIRASEALKHLPVIIFTTSDSSSDIKNCYSNGSNAFMSKPVDFASLVTAMQSLTDYWIKQAKIKFD